MYRTKMKMNDVILLNIYLNQSNKVYNRQILAIKYKKIKTLTFI